MGTLRTAATPSGARTAAQVQKGNTTSGTRGQNWAQTPAWFQARVWASPACRSTRARMGRHSIQVPTCRTGHDGIGTRLMTALREP